MQPFSPESIVETKRLNYGEISTQKCMALFRHNDCVSATKPYLAVSSTEFSRCLLDEGDIREGLGGGGRHEVVVPSL
jgi:hypothetical protein